MTACWLSDSGARRMQDERNRLRKAGGTLCNLGRLDEARALLERGRREWPEFRALTALLALVELSAGNDRRAALLLLQDAVGDHGTDASLRRYARSLRAYAADLEPEGE